MESVSHGQLAPVFCAFVPAAAAVHRRPGGGQLLPLDDCCPAEKTGGKREVNFPQTPGAFANPQHGPCHHL